MPVYIRIVLIGGPNVPKHLSKRDTRLENEIGRNLGK